MARSAAARSPIASLKRMITGCATPTTSPAPGLRDGAEKFAGAGAGSGSGSCGAPGRPGRVGRLGISGPPGKSGAACAAPTSAVPETTAPVSATATRDDQCLFLEEPIPDLP